ncbi:hypothetical protein A3A05_02940 [Candidatus Nomurabacteria bacterium RIFCSPLOWO2_01_FULL_41_12]|uniref:Uncharacterized protein n=1 Tax=Candidatus Nomurabacteria bacterium RIFCSPLOWO2_01_FULL_41_12 TaxID=1801774 RepID=A0A1F6WX66_9BACT|nr:MAG: hypothetical protein A2732_02845 [Candidatus Nomurabacteria bacterium RIFCSPHIGHO2_01_FULL_40_10]OGI86481.1 MAG: hypothetical protein A3A05_02940 [Candidatus Nomurabacteria bacterium RIFCSPLOWO2_01_FULL_41_12]
MKTKIKSCQNCKKDFTIEPDDFNFYEKMKVPPPTWCPECRLIRRLSFRNERYLYKSPCGLCKKEILSVYGSNVKRKVFCPACWWGDGWDQLESGMDYDFSKPFFEQYKALQEKAAVQSLFLHYQTIVDSDYNNLAGYLKNCYMVFHADHNERCMYASGLKVSNDSQDVLMLQKSDLCYESVNITKGYKNLYSVDCEECSEIYFCKNLLNCTDCIGCVNLRNQKYCIENVQYLKEEYEAKRKELDLSNYKNIKKYSEKAKVFWVKYPQKYMHSRKNVNSSGDYIQYSKNTLNSYEMVGAEDCRYCQFASTKTTRDCYDYTEYGENVEMVYETLLLGDGGANVKFTVQAVSNVRDVEYCYGVANVAHMFGCIGLRGRQYCILNKQYTKGEYEKLVPKIRQHMNEMPYKDKYGRGYKYGEFFPLELSSFSYNESTAHEFFPLDESKAQKQGYAWKQVEEKKYIPTKSWKDLPNAIKETDDSITNEIILCEDWDMDQKSASNHNCTKAFRILSQELLFYRKMNIPIPRKCPNSRHNDRIQFRNPIKLWHRECMCDKENHLHGKEKCEVEFETSYVPDRPEMVYCEKCYQQEVY